MMCLAHEHTTFLVRFKYNDQNCNVKKLAFPLDSAYRWFYVRSTGTTFMIFKMEGKFCQIVWLIDVGGCK